MGVAEEGERATIVGAPRKVEVVSEGVEVVGRKRLGAEEEGSVEEREGSWGRWEGVVEVFVVLFRDLQSRHGF